MNNKPFTMFMWSRDSQGKIVLNIDGRYLKHEEVITLRDELNTLLPKDEFVGGSVKVEGIPVKTEQLPSQEKPIVTKEMMQGFTLQEKFEILAEMMQEQAIQKLKNDGMNVDIHIKNYTVRIVPGRKYTKIDVGTSGKLMIDNVTQQIFGIKAYGQIHKGRYYGTLNTINEWNWGGDYYPRKIPR